MANREDLTLAIKAAAEQLPDNTGIIMLIAPTNTERARINYASNINREDVILMMKTFLIECGHKDDWMTHIK